MKKINFLLLSSLCVMVVACSQNDSLNQNPQNRTGSESTAQQDDRTITERIRQVIISDQNLSPSAKIIRITTSNGTVILQGVVNSEREKQDIEKKTKDIKGVKNVTNQLEIKAKPKNGDETADYQRNAPGSTKKATQAEIDKTTSQNLRQNIFSDESLAKNLKNFRVTTINGKVILNGTVSSLKDKQEIEKRAQKMDGVTKVQNNLEVISSSSQKTYYL